MGCGHFLAHLILSETQSIAFLVVISTLLVNICVVCSRPKYLTCNDIKAPTIIMSANSTTYVQMTIAGSKSSLKKIYGSPPFSINFDNADNSYLIFILGQTGNLLFGLAKERNRGTVGRVIYDLKAGTQLMGRWYDDLDPCSPVSPYQSRVPSAEAVVGNKFIIMCQRHEGSQAINTSMIVLTVTGTSGAYDIEENEYRFDAKEQNVLYAAYCFDPSVNQWHYDESLPTLNVSNDLLDSPFVTRYHQGKLYHWYSISVYEHIAKGWMTFPNALNPYLNKVYLPFYRETNKKNELKIVDFVTNKIEFVFNLPVKINAQFGPYLFIEPCTPVDFPSSSVVTSSSSGSAESSSTPTGALSTTTLDKITNDDGWGEATEGEAKFLAKFDKMVTSGQAKDQFDAISIALKLKDKPKTKDVPAKESGKDEGKKYEPESGHETEKPGGGKPKKKGQNKQMYWDRRRRAIAAAVVCFASVLLHLTRCIYRADSDTITYR